MGRSQVKYNQTHGRPGNQKGRQPPLAAAAAAASSSSLAKKVASAVNLGDNSWRYDKQELPDDVNIHDDTVMALTSFGNYTASRETTTITTTPHTLWNEQRMPDLLVQMAQLLSTMTLSEQLHIPKYLVDDDIIVQDLAKGKEPPTLKTQVAVLPMEEQPHDATTVDENQNNNDDEENIEEMDLNAWLDSVIS